MSSKRFQVSVRIGLAAVVWLAGAATVTAENTLAQKAAQKKQLHNNVNAVNQLPAAALAPQTATVAAQTPAASLPPQATSVVPVADEVKASSPSYSRDVQTRVDRKLLESGKVTTVEDGKRVVVDDASLKARADRSAVFYEVARPKAELVAVPRALHFATAPGGAHADPGPPQATLLREEVLLPTSAGDSTRLRTFVHDETGLNYVGARNQFEGRFAVALSPVEQNASVSLSNPKKMSVGLPGGTLIEPVPELVISKVDEWTPVSFSVKQPGKTYHVSVSASTSDSGDPVEVQVNEPSINLSTDQAAVPGYGLGTFIVSVSAPNLSEPKGAQITLQADGGMAESSNVVTLDANGFGTLKMRSIGTGKVIVRALPPFDSASVPITFKNPLLLLVLAVAGGIVGAVLMRKGTAKWSKVIRVGALTGLAMTVLYYVGLDWVVKATGYTTLASAGEAVAFALGLLGALVGMGVITGGAAKK